MPKGRNSGDAVDLPNPLADELAELGLKQDVDGSVQVKMLNTVSTGDFSGTLGEVRSCDPQLAVRLVRRGYAQAYVECSPTE
jgi:hypothetical protein